MIKWVIELLEFDIRYELGGPIKGQVLVDFIAELTPIATPSSPTSTKWILSIDEAYIEKGNIADIILEGPNGVLLK